MRLQRLEIAGFKSFPDRSELTFDTGVTAIVGPNGCGKSNVVDALTWVLGEQSAKSLRGDRMEDLIFGGSDARRPTGAAEVRLKLSGVAARVPGHPAGGNGRHKANGNGHGNGNGNGAHGNGNGHGNGHAVEVAAVADAQITSEGMLAGAAVGLLEDDTPLIVRDVELMRRLYRSGESEYLIDGETCRLKDVQDLLMDAGVGVKGYAVIEQGKIGQILSARPTDRRQLIEEAAGVTKYKSRRRAAELKLEAAQQNLTRVDDIVFEVEKQRGTLKRQAAKARRYRRLREELRRWEKVQFSLRYRALGAAIDAARTKLADARDREALAAARLSEIETAAEALRLELTQADAAETEARELAHARELAIGRLQQQVTFDRHQVETLGASAAGIEAEVASLEGRREPARIELEERRAAEAKSIAERDQAAADLAAEENTYSDLQVRIEGLEGDVEAARSEVFAAVNAATALRHAVEHAASARGRIGEQIAKLDVEAHDLRIESERAAQERAAAEAGVARAREAMDLLRVERAARESELAAARSTRESRARDFRAAEQEIAGIAARLRSLEELDAARAEYGDGARLVLAESNGNVGQMGSVADYLEVDSRYERAVEAGLGDLLQHVVVRIPRGGGGRIAFRRGAECRPCRLPGGQRGCGRGRARTSRGLRCDADGVGRPGIGPRRTGHRDEHRQRVDRGVAGRGQGRGGGSRRRRRHARRCRLSRRSRGRGRRTRRVARHPGDQARDQGAARAARGRTRGGRTPARGDRQPRHAGGRGRFRHRHRAGGAAPAGERHRRFRAAGAQRRGRARADRPETGADQRRAPHRRRGIARARKPARTRHGPRSPGSKRNSAAPTIA